MCYSSIATVTDLDCWAAECSKCGLVMHEGKCPKCGGPIKSLNVGIEEILETMHKNENSLRKLLELAIPRIPSKPGCSCNHRADGALM